MGVDTSIIRLKALGVLNRHFRNHGGPSALEDGQVKLVLDAMVEFYHSKSTCTFTDIDIKKPDGTCSPNMATTISFVDGKCYRDNLYFGEVISMDENFIRVECKSNRYLLGEVFTFRRIDTGQDTTTKSMDANMITFRKTK